MPEHLNEYRVARDILVGAFNSLEDAMVIVDARRQIIQMNEAAVNMTGYTRSELAGQAIECLVPVARREAHESASSAFALDPHPRPMGASQDIVLLHKSGAEIPVFVKLSPYNVDGVGQFVCAHIRRKDRNRLS